MSGQREPTILYEDAHVLAVVKPAGLVVHTDNRTVEPSLVEWVHAKYPDLKDIGGLHTLDGGRYVARYGVVHRLDRETSGVIIVAKDDETFYFLQRQFLDRSTEKTYNAFVHDIPQPEEGDILLPIGRSRSDFRRWTTGEDARGTLRDASTHYRVVESREKFSFVELTPKTGRTHQLRVHMKAIGHPILCDTRYDTPTGLGFTRLALHALSIKIKLSEGVQKTFTAPLPPDFLEAQKLFAKQ